MILISKVAREWPGLTRLLQTMVPKDIKEMRKQHLAFSADMIDKRMARKTERPDIWTFVTRYGEEEGGLNPNELHSNGALFMLAGTETTATELSGLTYLLMKNPDKLRRLTDELRASFASFDDMTMTNLSQLEYLGACIEEGLRLYPPFPVGPARVTPKGGASVCGRWVPGGVRLLFNKVE
jgi:cytochrome P450